MQAEITLHTMYYNPSVWGIFFTDQAIETFRELYERSAGGILIDDFLNHIEEYAVSNGIDADELGDMFHHETVEDLADTFGIEIDEDEDEDEDE